MIATIRVTSSRRGSGTATVTYGTRSAVYTVTREVEHGVELVTSRVGGDLIGGDVGSHLAELVAEEIRRGHRH